MIALSMQNKRHLQICPTRTVRTVPKLSVFGVGFLLCSEVLISRRIAWTRTSWMRRKVNTNRCESEMCFWTLIAKTTRFVEKYIYNILNQKKIRCLFENLYQDFAWLYRVDSDFAWYEKSGTCCGLFSGAQGGVFALSSRYVSKNRFNCGTYF